MAVLNLPWRRATPASQSEAPPAGQKDFDLFATAFQKIPDAVLIVQREGTAPAKIMAKNIAAREMLRIQMEGEQLVSVLRHPDVLAAVGNTLTTGKENTLAYDTGGLHSRALRVWVRPLSMPQTALIVLRDETEARRVERMRVDFLANASHELRTPLASLSGFIETLQGHAKQDSEARDRFLGIMAAQAKRMSRLIDDLLSLSRIERNEHIPPFGICDLALAVREAADGLLPSTAAKRKSIELLVPTSGEAPLVMGDQDQISQVVQNLLDNAMKYSPENTAISVSVEPNVSFDSDAETMDLEFLRSSGGGRLNLLSPERGHENLYIRLRVMDGGRGIAREHLPRLTERFYRVPGQKAGELAGTGLGLAIVKHIVNRHRGALVVESAPGLGTAFSVYFRPVARGSAPQEMASPPSVTKAL